MAHWSVPEGEGIRIDHGMVARRTRGAASPCDDANPAIRASARVDHHAEFDLARAAGGVRVKHGDADDLRSEGPEAALLLDFGATRLAGGFISQAFAFAKQVFFLGLVEAIQRQGGGFNVEY